MEIFTTNGKWEWDNNRNFDKFGLFWMNEMITLSYYISSGFLIICAGYFIRLREKKNQQI